MLCNANNKPDKLIDEKQIATLSVDYQTLTDMRIARSAFAAALDTLKEEGDETSYYVVNRFSFEQALAAVFDAGRVQGIREERARRKLKIS